MSCLTRRRKVGHGFTLVEVLIAVALSSTLVVAAAAAFTSSVRSVEMGDRYLRSSRTASRVLETIVSDVRSAMAVQVLSSTSMLIARDDGSVVTYRYEATPRELRLVQTIDGVEIDHVLARKIDTLAFSAVSQADPSTHVMRVVQVTVTMTLSDGASASTAMTASANCRRERSYQ